jgi:hypothetical protein
MKISQTQHPVTRLPEKDKARQFFPELMTEDELIQFLRIPEISKSKNHRQVIAHLKRFHRLPCIHISRQPLYPLEAIRQWVIEKVEAG